jgi:CubicO group peptidase (beta-lactamase class C family)
MTSASHPLWLRCVILGGALALVAAGCGDGPSRESLRGITSVLVERHGRIVEERYYGGTHAGDRLPVFSITKSVTSALVGIAVADGKLRLDEALPWRRQVTLRELLSMTAGYAPSFEFQHIDAQTLASRALVNRPGTFSYDSGSYDLLADLLQRATGLPIAQYAEQRLFRPLGVRNVRWPGGRGASGLLLRPRDLLAFGELYLHHGKGIVPAGWVRTSTRPHARIRRGLGYGYGWWVRPRSYAGYGYLDQIVAVYPKRDEVVVVTASREDAQARALVRRIAGGE